MTQGLFEVLRHGIITVRKRKTHPQIRQQSTALNFKNFTNINKNSQNNKNKLFLALKMFYRASKKNPKKRSKKIHDLREEPIENTFLRIFFHKHPIFIRKVRQRHADLKDTATLPTAKPFPNETSNGTGNRRKKGFSSANNRTTIGFNESNGRFIRYSPHH